MHIAGKLGKNKLSAEVDSAKRIVNPDNKIANGEALIFGKLEDVKKQSRYKMLFKFGKIYFPTLLIIFIVIVFIYIFLLKPNKIESPNLPNKNISTESLTKDLNKELENPVKLNDPIKQRQYFDSMLLKLNATGDSTGTAQIYVKSIQPTNITFDVEIQEWIISSLIAGGYKDSAKKAINDTLPILNEDFQQAEEQYKQNISIKISYYQKLEASL